MTNSWPLAGCGEIPNSHLPTESTFRFPLFDFRFGFFPIDLPGHRRSIAPTIPSVKVVMNADVQKTEPPTATSPQSDSPSIPAASSRRRRLGKTNSLNAAAARHWERMFKVLRIFCRTQGHCDVPANPAPDSLSHWLMEQRQLQTAGRLSPEQFRRLDAMGVFTEDKQKHTSSATAADNEQRWEKKFNQLLAFKKKYGHPHLPATWQPDPSLGHWVSVQRQIHRRGNLLPARFKRLDKIGFGWQGDEARQLLWDKQLAKLAAFKQRFGHCDVNCHWKEDIQLGHWVSVQRECRRKGKLSPERIDRLDRLGFKWVGIPGGTMPRDCHGSWDAVHARLWNAMFAALRQFKKQHGHCNVAPADGRNRRLNRWVIRQRIAARNQTLAADHRRQLDEIGFSWDGQAANRQCWEKNLAKLAAYKKRFGHCAVPSRWKKDPALGSWVTVQRDCRRKGKLAQDRIDRLDRLGFQWVIAYDRQVALPAHAGWSATRDLLWDAMFAVLRKYQKQQGHSFVRVNDGLQGRLHKWVIRQRIAARNKTLPAARRQQLDKIGFSWDAREADQQRWEKNFTKLVAYQKRFGHCNVNCHWKEDVHLGYWVSVQRECRHKGKLSPDRIDRLERLGFKWRLAYYPGKKNG